MTQERLNDMSLPIFLCGFFLTILTGLPFSPLIIIWSALYETIGATIAWSMASGILWGFIVGNMVWWVACFSIGGLLLYGTRILIFRKITFAALAGATFFLLTFLSFAGANQPENKSANTNQTATQEKFYAIDAKIQIPSIEIAKNQENSFIVLPDARVLSDVFFLNLFYILCLSPCYAFAFQKKQSY